MTRTHAAGASLSDPQKAVLFILGVGLFFTAMDVCAKALSAKYDPFFVIWARYVGQAVGAALVFAPSLARRMRSARPGVQVARSALLFTATCFFFSAFAVMPLADVIAVAQTAPLAITALAALFLGERVGPYRWAAVCAGFVGALIILRPGSEGASWAALLPLFGALAFAAYGVATRFLSQDDSPWTTFLFTGSVGAVAASLAVPFFWSAPRMEDLPLLAVIGLFGAAGQLCFIFALRAASASFVAPFLYINMVWAALAGWVFFSETPDGATALGAAVIAGAGLFVHWRERRLRRAGGS